MPPDPGEPAYLRGLRSVSAKWGPGPHRDTLCRRILETIDEVTDRIKVALERRDYRDLDRRADEYESLGRIYEVFCTVM